VSRTHPGLVRQLFTLEVPEIADGIVELKAVAREPGQRTKIAVAATNPDVDPVGACIGPRGGRVSKVLDELGNEKVDIVRWSADPIVYITNALSPAQISKVILTEQAPKFSVHGEEKRDEGEEGEAREEKAQGTATVIVSEDQQSLAIGKQGQNVRLAARLTGWRIDIRTEKQYAEEQAKRMFELDMAPRRVVAERATQPDALAAILPLTLEEEAPSGAEGAEGESASAESEILNLEGDVLNAESAVFNDEFLNVPPEAPKAQAPEVAAAAAELGAPAEVLPDVAEAAVVEDEASLGEAAAESNVE